MEIWILLAAAGSGYLAHCWQNLLKSKEASSDVSDDDDDLSSSSSGFFSSRRRFGRLSSSSRLKTSFNQNWHVSKFDDGVGKMTIECATHLYDPIGNDDDRDDAQASQNGVIRDTCSCSKIFVQSHRGLDAAGSYLTSTKSNTNSPARCPAIHTFKASCALNCCCGFNICHQNCEGHGLMSADAYPSYLYFAHCTWDSATDIRGSMRQGQLPFQLLCDALDNDMASEEEGFSYDRTWMPGFWNAFEEDTSVLETNSSLIMQEHERKRSTNTRKARSHQKSGSCFSSRESRFPSTSSEGCSSIQFDDMHSQEEPDSNIQSSSACEQPFNGPGENLGNELAEANMSDSFPSEKNHGLILSPRNESFNLLSKKTISVGEKAAHSACLPCLPLQNSRRGQVNASRECSASPGGDDCLLQGTVNSLLKALLFNFGVGVGMMFAILSNKHCTKLLMEPLEDTLCSLKDLEEELHGRTKLMVECYETKDTREDTMAEQFNALFKVVRRIFDVVEEVRKSLSQDLASISAMEFMHSKERVRLEAELEAELERMEMNLNIGDAAELGRRISGVSEDDLKIGNLVQGELSIRGLPCDAESITVIDDSADSCYDVIHHGNFAVPATELANRLHDVLEARQEREILELGAEVKNLNGRLQAKQEELQVWKQRALHLLQGSTCESFSSFQEKDVCVQATETAEKVLRAEEPCVGMHCSTFNASPSSRCNDHIFSSCTKEDCSSHLRVQPPVTCVINEADDEVPEEIFQLLSDTVIGSPSSSLNDLLTGAHAKDNRNKGMPLSHQELESTVFSNDATDETLDDTRCSLKFVDKHTIIYHYLDDKQEHNAGLEASSRNKHSNLGWNEEVMPISEAISYSQDKPSVYAQDIEEKSESYVQFRHTLDCSTSEDGSYSSDLDEKLGQLLIKCIVEKSKRGSLIVEAAQTAMASFDNDETILRTGLSGVW